MQNTALVDKKLQSKEFTYDYSYWSADSRDSHFANQEQVSQLPHYTTLTLFSICQLFMLNMNWCIRKLPYFVNCVYVHAIVQGSFYLYTYKYIPFQYLVIST